MNGLRDRDIFVKGSDTSKRKRIVIKIGSSTLTTPESSIDYEYMESLAVQVSALREEGFQIIIVTSAAITCGLKELGIAQRPSDMPSLQAAASVGQSVLSASYACVFEPLDIKTSLVLLTRRDTADRTAYLHARDTFLRLLDLGVVPIVNENDTVSVDHIRFGENDTLAACVACLVEADLLIILSDVDGLYSENPRRVPTAKRIVRVDHIDDLLMGYAGSAGSAAGTGGMLTKLRAARVLMVAGIPLVICNGRSEQVLKRVVSGEKLGTLFVAGEKRHEITPRKLWIALGDAAHGAFVVDAGAKSALLYRGSSLLAVGISRVEGRFDAGDIVDIKDVTGHIFARGKSNFSSDEAELACGKTRESIERNRLLCALAEKPVVHRDELVVFE